MNIETFLCNENFYKKLALTIALIRLTPADLTPRQYTIKLRNILQQNKINENIRLEQILVDIHSRKKFKSATIPFRCFDMLEHYKNFLQHIFMISTEFNIEMQIIIIETIDRIFQLMQENFFRMKQQKFETLFKQLINAIFNFDIVPNIQKHCIEHLQRFIDLALTYVKQSIIKPSAQMFIEQIGCHQTYFLIVFERILDELIIHFDRSNLNTNYGLTLVNVLQKLVTSNNENLLEQLLNNEKVRQQFHELLYRCLAWNNIDNDISLVVYLWNIYGRIL